ncbi:uncharacterized protein LOC120151466 [Hibiscus syriacus]|uniref:uncharacterized protein LOC120151466 n=1 Tax=Hibiscus syriacus TaxID=106335 RepID=UPI00192250F8|nr:uncharacterized protein LOC120151466 [Hibiscus syriacus]
MKKKSNENFRQYAQRWRDIVVQVHPPIEEDETIVLFVNTLRAPFFTHLIGNSFKIFIDIVTVGEMIEMAVKSVKLDSGESSKKPLIKKKESEVNNVRKYESNNIMVSRPQDTSSSIQNHARQRIRERQEREKPQFDPIPMTYKELFHILYDKHVVSPYHISPVQPPYPKCLRSKNVINYGDNEQPNMTQNPLPNHADFRYLVQKLMDEKEMEFFNEVPEEEEMNICTSEGSPRGIYNYDCPLIITLRICVSEKITPIVVIIPPSPFLYKDDKQVPWKYGCKMDDIVKEKDEVNEVGHFTRSGRCYSKEPEKQTNVDKGKKVDLQLREYEHVINEPVTENEAVEFLKFLKHSEYNIVEQLHKLYARISVLALLLSSEAHRNALLKVLNQTFVPKELSVNKLDRLVANIQGDNFISFSEDEIPSGMNGIPKAMHITIKCKGHILSRVLVDNGSTLNVMPLVTLKKLPVDSKLMRNSQGIV